MTEPLPLAASQILIQLLKGVLYRDRDSHPWQPLLEQQARVRDYFQPLGLELVLDEAEGYAFLRQAEDVEERGLPRLIAKRPLSYPVTLLCVLLRKRLLELDAGGGETRLILSRTQIQALMQVYLPATSNEARRVDRIDGYIGKVADYGFLRPLQGDDQRFEVRRIIKALITADYLAELEAKLLDYRDHANAVD